MFCFWCICDIRKNTHKPKIPQYSIKPALKKNLSLLFSFRLNNTNTNSRGDSNLRSAKVWPTWASTSQSWLARPLSNPLACWTTPPASCKRSSWSEKWRNWMITWSHAFIAAILTTAALPTVFTMVGLRPPAWHSRTRAISRTWVGWPVLPIGIKSFQRFQIKLKSFRQDQ